MDYQSLQFRKLSNVQPAPVAGGLSVINVPKGPTYYGFGFRYKTAGVNATEAQIKADIKWVRVKINGIALIELTGKHIVDVFNKYYGIAYNNGEMFLPLSRPWMKTPEAADNTAWGTANIDTMTIEVEFAATAVTPTLEAHSIYSIYSRDLGVVVEMREVTFTSAVTGLQEITTLLKTRGDIVALHVDHGGIVSTCDIEVNNQLYTQAQDIPLVQNFTKWFALRSPQTNYLHFEGQMRDMLSDGIPITGTQDFRLKPTLTAAGTIYVVQETLNAPLGAARSKSA